jgi:hypothetical protein
MRFAALLAALGLGLPMAAQASSFEPLTTEQLSTCLVQPQALPSYPTEERERKSGAHVRVLFTFVAPDAAPTVDIFFNSGSPAFAEAVKAHAIEYRLPCMPPGRAPVKMTREFNFSVTMSRAVSGGPARMSDLDQTCISFGKGRPDYPKSGPIWSQDLVPQGTVLAEVSFAGVDLPPAVRILFDGGHPKLGRSVADHITAQYRMTCAPSLGFPLVGVQSFVFRIDGETQYRLKDVGLRSFVGALADLKPGGPIFDFHTMACPFEVELSHFRPYAGNAVYEVGAANPNRREFIEWLREARLNLPSDAAKQLVGAAIKISVPCGKLDLS